MISTTTELILIRLITERAVKILLPVLRRSSLLELLKFKVSEKEIKAYKDSLYGLPEHARLFPVVREAVQHKCREKCKTGVRSIRVHDLRHSHIAYLINQGIEPLLIKERVGHKDIGITLNTYGHLYPNKARSVVDMLDNNN